MNLFLLLDLLYAEELTQSQYQKLAAMLRNSSTFQLILAKGRAEAALAGEKRFLLIQGRKRFGEPDAATVAAIEAITSVEELDALAERLLEVGSWQEWLAPLAPADPVYVSRRQSPRET